jgi:hypothetical protein
MALLNAPLSGGTEPSWTACARYQLALRALGGVWSADGRGSTRKAMIVAVARKLLIALWRLATTGEVSDGISRVFTRATSNAANRLDN